jgi:hypothetical protein
MPAACAAAMPAGASSNTRQSRRRDADAGGGLQENVRRRFAARHVRARDRRPENGFQPQRPKAGVHVFTRGGGTHGAGNAPPPGCLQECDDAGDGADAVAPDPRAVELFLFEPDAVGFRVRHRPAQQLADDGPRAQPAFADVLRIGTGEAVRLRDGLPRFDVQRVGIDHDAVEVEQESGMGRRGHRLTSGRRA